VAVGLVMVVARDKLDGLAGGAAVRLAMGVAASSFSVLFGEAWEGSLGLVLEEPLGPMEVEP
jgi:hypothetical protein